MPFSALLWRLRRDREADCTPIEGETCPAHPASSPEPIRINDERPRACPYIGLSLANFLGFLSFFSARARAFLFLSASLCFSGSAYGIKIALLRSDQRRGLEYFSRKKYNIPVKNRWLQVLDTCNYWGQAGSRPLDLFLFYATNSDITSVFRQGRTRHKPSNIKGFTQFRGGQKRVGHAANPVISRVYEGRTLNDQRPSMGGRSIPHRERLSSKMLDKITPDGATKNAK